jgi:predicted site-specific integrase-resolvase
VTPRKPLPELMKGPEASALLKVDPKTLTRWAKAARIRCVRLPSGHYRYYAADVEAIVRGEFHG